MIFLTKQRYITKNLFNNLNFYLIFLNYNAVVEVLQRLCKGITKPL